MNLKYLIITTLLSVFICHAQENEAARFNKEINLLQQKNDSLWNASKETVVFTGSSSIRMWHNVQEMFPDHQIVNTGFGGSQASDLLYHLESSILKYNPKKVFIYEGDNDIFLKKKGKDIIITLSEIIKKIKDKNPKTEIVLISAKPSISRWNLKRKYKGLNRKMAKLAKQLDLVSFCNVWNTMLTKRKLKQDIFIQDGLHMNAKGYDLWYHVIKNYLNN